VFKSSPHQAQDWKFVQFLVSKQSNSYWNQKVGEIPAKSDASTDTWVQREAPVKMTADVISDPATTIIEPPYYLPQFSSITKTDMAPLFQKVLLGQLSAQAFAAKFAQEMTQAQQDWLKHHH